MHGSLAYEELLQADPLIRQLLQHIPLPKHILTNADAKHMETCLRLLGLSDLFASPAWHFESVQQLAAQQGAVQPGPQGGQALVVCKPGRLVYELVLQEHGVRPEEVIFLDDSVRNIAAAHELGMYTVLVGRDAPCPGADLVIPSLHQLPEALPELFGAAAADAAAAVAQVGKSPLRPLRAEVTQFQVGMLQRPAT